MRFIGITGGVGSGKSAVLDYIRNNYPAKVILADELAAQLQEPGHACYDLLRQAFAGEDVFLENGSIDRNAMAQLVFSDETQLRKMNEIVHPQVKEEVLRLAEQFRMQGVEYFFLEAALLIEERYDLICDELWFVYAKQEVRRERLRINRNYSDEKIDAILANQLPDDVFFAHCKVVIDNNGTQQATFTQIDKALNHKRRGESEDGTGKSDK